MDTFEQRNEINDFIELLEEETWTAEDTAELEKCLAEVGDSCEKDNLIPSSTSPLGSTTGCILEYSSTGLLPSSVPDDRFQLGTRSAPIEIPDDPGRENSGPNKISNSRGRKNALNPEGTQRMDNSNQRNKVHGMIAPLDKGNVSGHKLPTIEPVILTAEEIAQLDQYLAGIGDICENDSQVIPPSTSPLERATECILGYSSTKVFPSSSAPVPDGRLLLGTKASPIEILDSPGRENSTPTEILESQGRKNSRELEGTQRSNKEKRAREPESEVQILCSNRFDKMKRAKQMHEYQHEKIKRTLNAPLSVFNVPTSTSLPQRREIELSSIQIALDSTKCYPVWDDGVDQVGGRLVISEGKDLLLEELLGGDHMQGGADHLFSELGSVSFLHSGDEYFSRLPATCCDHSTGCSRERDRSIF